MHAKLFCATLRGVQAEIVEVEVEVHSGLPSFVIVGLADTSIKESKERIRASLRRTGFKYPMEKIVINLAPANLLKHGTQFDLPIALGILQASGQLRENFGKRLVLGELGMDGALRRIKGALNMVVAAKDSGFEEVLFPMENYEESKIAGMKCLPFNKLEEVVKYYESKTYTISQPAVKKLSDGIISDFVEIYGQDFAKRGLEIAAAGQHNLIFKGPPGSGKTMLSQRLKALLPLQDTKSFLETAKIFSAAGMEVPLVGQRPFRDPHHAISLQAFVGGGVIPKPGEISFAHNGILFLDELPEFKRESLEALREPLENKQIRISRLNSNYIFPANFILVASYNPCPCGYFEDENVECKCSAADILRYNKKISGPLLDRIDIQIKVERVDFKKITKNKFGEDLENVRQKVLAAQDFALLRQGKINSALSNSEIKKHCEIDSNSQEFLFKASDKFNLSMRGYFKILKLSRTIADLDRRVKIAKSDLAEAFQYRVGV